MPPLKLALLHGTTASGKTFLTERVLAIDYDVHTAKLDGIYYKALEYAGVPREGKAYSVYKEAHRMRQPDGYDERTRERFFAKLAGQLHKHVKQAHDWGVTMVFEGYTLRLPDEVRMIVDAARSVSGGSFEVSRLQVRPTLEDWNRNRLEKFHRLGHDDVARTKQSYYERKMASAEPVQDVNDFVVADENELRKLIDEELQLRRHRWYQRVEIGPVTTTGPSDANEKVGKVLDTDVSGRRVLDVCCATGVHAILAKTRGAHSVIGVEHDTRRYCKALELKKTLIRHSDLDAKVDFKLGDALVLMPTLGRFDTTMFFGAIHYFEDCVDVLSAVGRATGDAAYIEFIFSEGEHDTAQFPSTIRPYQRSKSGTTIYMGDRPAVLEAVRAGMPEFEVEDQIPISPPGRSSDREIWRLRRRG